MFYSEHVKAKKITVKLLKIQGHTLDIWDCGDLIMYQYWYNIGLLQEIYGETVAISKFKFISLEWNHVSLSRLKSP